MHPKYAMRDGLGMPVLSDSFKVRPRRALDDVELILTEDGPVVVGTYANLLDDIQEVLACPHERKLVMDEGFFCPDCGARLANMDSDWRSHGTEGVEGTDE